MAKSVNVSILIDYSKAFEAIDHGMLLTKLRNLNFSKDLIKNFPVISRTVFNTYISRKQSSIKPINFGVPQDNKLSHFLVT